MSADAAGSLADWLSAIANCVVALAALKAANTWKREMFSRRRVDLAEQTLTRIYEAEELIHSIRVRSFFGRRVIRKPAPAISDEISDEIDDPARRRYLVLQENLDDHTEFFSTLRALRPRLRALFGRETESIVEAMNGKFQDMQRAASSLLRLHEEDGPDEGCSSEIAGCRSIVFVGSNDEFRKQVGEIVDRAEDVLGQHIELGSGTGLKSRIESASDWFRAAIPFRVVRRRQP